MYNSKDLKNFTHIYLDHIHNTNFNGFDEQKNASKFIATNSNSFKHEEFFRT